MGRMVSIPILSWVVCVACLICWLIAFILFLLYGGVTLVEPNYIILGAEIIMVFYALVALVQGFRRLKSARKHEIREHSG